MRTFHDAAGRPWDVAVNVTTIDRVKSSLGIDLIALIEDGCKPLSNLLKPPHRDLVGVLYCLCKRQIDKLGISAEEFGEGFCGEPIGVAADCFVQELINFFHESKVRESLTKLIQKSKAINNLVMEQATSEANQALDKADLTAMAKKIMAEIKKKALATSSASESLSVLELSASTLAPELTANS